MNVVVSGGAGFIGSHVCDVFLAAGHRVVAIDDLSTGRKQNLAPGVSLVVADIRSADAADVIRREHPHVLCHLAAQMDVRRSVAEPGFDAESNILGLLNLLEAAREARVGKVVFSSTGGAIYGEQDVFPAPESHPTRPVSPYGVSKAAGELYLGYYRAQYGLRSVALRYANVYGPRQNPHGEAGVVAIFTERLLRGEPCTIFGSGRQTRDFIHGLDVARANLLAAENEAEGPINIGTGLETDITELHARLANAAGVHQAALYAAAKPGEQLRSCLDNRLAARALGWSPSLSLNEGLAQTVAWFREGGRR